jgi:hypothetical protein
VRRSVPGDRRTSYTYTPRTHLPSVLGGHGCHVFRVVSDMSKKDFIALADYIKQCRYGVPWTAAHLEVLADFCQSRNSAFKRDRWFAYIRGECGPNGGQIK